MCRAIVSFLSDIEAIKLLPVVIKHAGNIHMLSRERVTFTWERVMVPDWTRAHTRYTLWSDTHFLLHNRNLMWVTNLYLYQSVTINSGVSLVVENDYENVGIDGWAEHCINMHANTDIKFAEEYESICKSQGQDISWKDSLEPANLPKNRYNNIVACE